MTRNSFLILLVISPGCLSLTQDLTYTEFTRYITFKDAHGIRLIDLASETDALVISRRTALETERYLLYTRNNPTLAQILKANDPRTIESSYYNPNVSTVVTVHGWLGNEESGLNEAIRNAYFVKSDVNLIIFDWHEKAVAEYVFATLSVPGVGRELGRFLRALHSITGVPYSSMHLIGHSLGAHVVGNAGRKLGGKVARITGLDPAGPLWGLNGNRLRATDGVYVEIMHTNGGALGMTSALGDTDFYPNGGSYQPGCVTSICSHSRSWELYASSVTNNLFGYKCNRTLLRCSEDILPMGNDDLKKSGTGIYWLQTTDRYPYKKE